MDQYPLNYSLTRFSANGSRSYLKGWEYNLSFIQIKTYVTRYATLYCTTTTTTTTAAAVWFNNETVRCRVLHYECHISPVLLLFYAPVKAIWFHL